MLLSDIIGTTGVTGLHVTCSASVIFVLLYLHHRKRYSFWSSQGIKGPTPWPIFGTQWETFFETIQALDMKNVQKYGKVFGTYDGTTPMLMITDPAIIEQVYVTEFSTFSDNLAVNSPDPLDSLTLIALGGDKWKRVRGVITSALTVSKLKRTSETVTSCVDSFVKYLDEAATGQKDIELKEVFGLFIIDVVAKAFYSLDLNIYEDQENMFFKSAENMFTFDQMSMFMNNNFPAFINNLLGFRFMSGEGSDYVKNVVLRVAAERKKSGLKYPDVLQHLMDAEKGNVSAEKANFLTETEVLSNAISLVAGTYEGAAANLSFAAYYLAINPQLQDNIFEEVNKAVGPEGKIDYETLNKLVYTEACLMEALRLNPGDLRGFRRPVKDVTLNGINLPKGTPVVSLYSVLHMDPSNFPDPETFDPTRFLPENKANIKRCSFMTFGAGPRMCPGVRFAQMVGKLALGNVMQKFTFERSPLTQVPIVYRKAFILSVAKSLNVRVKRRK